MSRYHNRQLQATENYSYLINLRLQTFANILVYTLILYSNISDFIGYLNIIKTTIYVLICENVNEPRDAASYLFPDDF